MSFEICINCGSINPAGKICKSCTTYIKTPERKNYIKKKIILHKNKISKMTQISTQVRLAKHKQKAIRYSENRGLEWDIDIERPTRFRVNICIKCQNLKAEWEGVWVKAGGPYASDNPEIPVKRVFLCGQCWSPSKRRNSDSTNRIE